MRTINANVAWADKYRLFCQPVYQAAYSAPKLGIPPELFSAAEFDDESTKQYFYDMFAHNHVWLMIDEADVIIGGIAASDTDPVHLSGFYVDTSQQGKGIGRKLFDEVVKFAGSRDIVLDVMKHRRASIELYEHLGFEIDLTAPERLYNWPYPTEVGRQNGAGITMRRSAEYNS